MSHLQLLSYFPDRTVNTSPGKDRNRHFWAATVAVNRTGTNSIYTSSHHVSDTDSLDRVMIRDMSLVPIDCDIFVTDIPGTIIASYHPQYHHHFPCGAFIASQAVHS